MSDNERLRQFTSMIEWIRANPGKPYERVYAPEHLRDVNLRNLDLRNVSFLQTQSMFCVDFRGADLRGVILLWSTYERCRFDKARVADVRWSSPTNVLLASWCKVGPELRVELMRYDAANHPDPTAFDRWARTGACPYICSPVQRAARFKESRKLWSPGPAKSAYQLMQMLLARCCDLTP